MNALGPLLITLFLSLTLAGCATEPYGLPSNGVAASEPIPTTADGGETFRADNLAWSTHPGGGSIQGLFAFRNGATRFVCQGSDVILSPESAWSRRRMIILYGSATGAAVPVSIVRARTPAAPAGDYARFVRKTTCDSANHFSFAGLASGAWFVITVGKPVDGHGEAIAVTRRVDIHDGAKAVTLN